MIRVKELTRSYGDFIAVRNVSFEIETGEVVGLLGHNGAGKSTIMKTLTGVLEPTSGSVEIDGIDVVTDRLAVQQDIGFLPEVAPTYPEMAVMEYLFFVAELRGIPAEKRRERVQEVVSVCALEEKALAPIQTLSKGYRQRVGVAQAIIHEPKFLILDEPTSGLDPSQIQEMRNLIRELRKKATIILSTHILQEVEAMCDRVIIIRSGEIAADSKLDDLQRSNRLVVHVNAGGTDTSKLLEGVRGVVAVQGTQAPRGSIFHFSLEIESDAEEVAPMVAEAVISKGLRLFQLEREQRNLESIFREINRV